VLRFFTCKKLTLLKGYSKNYENDTISLSNPAHSKHAGRAGQLFRYVRLQSALDKEKMVGIYPMNFTTTMVAMECR
jgi:hypothetical protein